MKIRVLPSEIFAEREQWQNYMNGMGFYKKWDTFRKFIEGEQWPAPTEKTKNMPRPVINQCDFTVENKKSNILSQSLKMIFSPDEMSDNPDIQKQLAEASQNYSDEAEATWNDLDEDQLNEDWVNDALSVGTGIKHYYFDNSVVGGQFTKYIGAIRGDIINPANIILGNPKLKATQTQKQPYIAFETREFTEDLKEQASKTGENAELIVPDNKDNDSNQSGDKKDIEDVKKTTAVTKYYRQDKQIMWTKVTENAVIQKPRPLAPSIDEKGNQIPNVKPFTLYPIEILVFKKRNECTFGRSMIEDLIPSQKAINFFVAMMLLSTQQTAWPKIISKMGALVGQTITNEPGENLIDHSQTGTDGIKYMQPPNFSNMPMVLTDKLIEMNRLFTGTTEVATGEAMGANMAASAIVALQNQANKPVENQQRALFRSEKNVGRIWEEFYKCHYNQPRPLTTEKDMVRTTKQFVGSDSADMSFGLNVEIGPKSVFSESLQMNVLDSYAQRGWLSKFEHAKYSPDNILPSALKHDFAQLEEEQKQNPPKPQPDKPGISISFDSLPQDARVQLLSQIGVKSDGGMSPSEQANLQIKQSEIELKQQTLLKDTLDSHANHINSNRQGGGVDVRQV